MQQFWFRAARPDGSVVEDRLVADNEIAARAQLESRGWLVFRVKAGGTLGSLLHMRIGGNRLPLREFLVFNQELLALIKAGLPILKTFELLAERARNPKFQAALQGVRNEIRGGASISEATARYPNYFPELYRASLRSGEQTGGLVEVLQRYLAYLKMVIGVREKVTKALWYPAFLVLFGGAVVVVLLMFVMPTFTEIYGQGSAELPWATQLLLNFIDVMKRWLPWMVLGGIGLVAIVGKWAQTARGRWWLDRMSLSLPFVGDVLLKNQIVRMARTLSTIIAGGIPLLNAMQITSGAVTNRVIAEALRRATDRFREGFGFAASLREQGFLPPMTLEMIEVGETTGSLDLMLQDVAEFHEGELDLRLSQLTTWIEPALIVLMGIVVGGIVIIMYLPIFHIAGTV